MVDPHFSPFLLYTSLNFQIVPSVQAVLPAASRAAAYGDGCFETLRSYQGRFLALDRHVERLRQGMQALGIRPPRETSEARFAHWIRELLEANGLLEADARVRIQVWRTGPLGYQSPTEAEPIVLINAFSLGQPLPPLRLGWVSIRRIPAACLPSHLKLSNGLNYILAQREAAAEGYDEALMCDIGGRISETTMANVFWLRDGLMETPSLQCDVLPGITRELVLEMVRESSGRLGPGVREVEAAPELLNEASAVFTCNSLRELHPVASVDGRIFPADSSDIRRILDAWSVFRNERLM